MENVALASRPCQSSAAFTGSADSSFDDCFERMWHYDCVFTSQSVQVSLNTYLRASSASADCSHSERLPNVLACEKQGPEVDGDFPCRSWTHRLQALFQILDEDNDGKVSVDELMSLLRKLGSEVSRSYLISLMEPPPGNTDMAVNFDEFTVLYRSVCNTELSMHTQEEGAQRADTDLDSGELQDTFNVYDKNRDGYICATELAAVLQNLGFPEGRNLEECQNLIDRVDTDGNGLVDLQEFKQMLWWGCGISESPSKRSCASETTVM